MKIRIDKIYGSYYHDAFDKYVVIARVYINGVFRHKRLFFNSAAEADAVSPGMIIDY